MRPLQKGKDGAMEGGSRIGIILNGSQGRRPIPSATRGGERSMSDFPHSDSAPFVVFLTLVKKFTIDLEVVLNRSQLSGNRTRQGYARKRILKPAGRFFYTRRWERAVA